MKRIEESLAAYFEGKSDIVAAYLFGSVAAGKDSPESDVDIAVLTKPYRDCRESFRARAFFQEEISRLTGRDVDLVFLREAGELLSYEILTRGKVVSEGDQEAHRSFRASRIVQCLDFHWLEKRMQRGMLEAMRRSDAG